MPNLGPTELLIIAVVLVLLFGAKKLPDTARAIGRSLRIFKSETSKLRDDETAPPTVTQVAPQQPAPAPAPQPLPAATPALSAEEQARRLEEEAARLRAEAAKDKTS